MRVLALLVLGSLLLAGCLQVPGETDAATLTAGTPFPHDAAFDATGSWSKTLLPGPHGFLPVEEIWMPSFDGTKIHMGIFLPDVPEGTKVPVIVDAGPYYGDGDEPATSDKTHRLGGFLIENFVPHGYAVAQVSIRGTGLSGGCVDYMGDKEQADLDAAVTFLGEQPWSSGAIAMIGRSYDGSTPWEVATFGNPYLKTIVPISGITDLQQLHYRNGSAEVRSLILGSLYYSYGATDAGLGGPDQDEDPATWSRMACAEGPQHTPMGAYGYLTGGGRMAPGPTDAYWETRSFTSRVLENYQGSIFYIHGLQDWNVKPSQGVDVYNAFQGPKKALLGQWGHNYPDRPDEHDHLRWDWAEMLLRWFDQELKGVETDTGPGIIIQDHRGNWRDETRNAWPPQDATWTTLFPSEDGTLVAEGASGSVTLFAPTDLAGEPPMGEAVAPRVATFESEPFPEPTRISGQPRFHVKVTPSTPGGNLWAELWEVPAKGDAIRIGRAQMDLRYAAGGTTPVAVTPNVPTLALMEFFPLDARLLAGSKLALLVTGEGSGDNLPNPMTSQMTIELGDDISSLQLPIIERAFTPSRWDAAAGEVKRETA
jgi:predicted acyl esterase